MPYGRMPHKACPIKHASIVQESTISKRAPCHVLGGPCKLSRAVRGSGQTSQVGSGHFTKAQSQSPNQRVKLLLIGDFFFQNFQSLEIIVDVYRDTEAFCHYFVKFSRSNKIRKVKLRVFGGGGNRNICTMKKLREKNMEIMGKKAHR